MYIATSHKRLERDLEVGLGKEKANEGPTCRSPRVTLKS